MSAFRVDKTHIDALLTAGMSAEYTHNYGCSATLTFTHKGIEFRVDTFGAQEIGAALMDLNNRAVNQRYREDEAPEPYAVRRLNIDVLPPVVILNLIAGYRYQACEATGWEDTLAATYLEVLEQAAIRALPGWSEAPWHLTEETYTELLADAQTGAAQ